MSSVGLLRLAGEAEALRIKRSVSLGVRRYAMIAVASLFAAGAVLLLHIAGWHALTAEMSAARAALVLALADGLLAIVLFVFARPRTDPIGAEAAALRSALLAQASVGGAVGSVARDIALRTPVAIVGGVLAEAALAAFRRR